MKKSLVALAALAAVGAASAQSSVTLYGIIDVGYGSHTTTTRSGAGRIHTQGVMEGANSSTRIGFRGTEDLGGGLKANFVLEEGLLATDGTLFAGRNGTAGHQVDGFSSAGSATALSGAAGSYVNTNNRQSYLGLSSATFGTVNVGYQYTVLYELATLSGYNIGTEGMPGADKAHVHGQIGTGGTRANMIQYISPDFAGGFRVRAQYGAGAGREEYETTTTGPNGLQVDKARRMAVMLQYANGPLSLAGAYTNYRVQQSNGFGAAAGQQTSVYGFIVGAQPFVPGAVLTGDSRTGHLFQLGGSYDFGVAKVGATFNTGKNGGLGTFAAGSTAAGVIGATGQRALEYDYRSAQIGVSVPFGAIVPFVTVGRARTDSNAVNGVGPTLAAAATNRIEDYKQWMTGVRYSLSKRTTAYAFYGQVKNDAAALAGATSYYKDRKAIVGMQHNF